MGQSSLEDISRLIIHLFENSDATVIEFGDPPIKVTRGSFYNTVDENRERQIKQNIQIINNISQQINIDNKVVISGVLNQLEAEGRTQHELEEARKKLNELNQEMQKKNPKWDKIKKILIWALDFGKDVFIQLLPLLIKSGAQ
jgi:DNA repair exonuclease SbcCD ATPase subunit